MFQNRGGLSLFVNELCHHSVTQTELRLQFFLQFALKSALSGAAAHFELPTKIRIDSTCSCKQLLHRQIHQFRV